MGGMHGGVFIEERKGGEENQAELENGIHEDKKNRRASSVEITKKVNPKMASRRGFSLIFNH